MQGNPYLAFNRQCAAAFKFYERCLGGSWWPSPAMPAWCCLWSRPSTEQGAANKPLQMTGAVIPAHRKMLIAGAAPASERWRSASEVPCWQSGSRFLWPDQRSRHP
jgi:hypothetical protein